MRATLSRQPVDDVNAPSTSVARIATVSAAIGLCAGVASGLLGVGGGIVMVPLLTAFAGLSQHNAHGTSLAAIVPIALVAATVYIAAGEIDYPMAALLAGGSLVGAPLGARLMARTGEGSLTIMFGVLMLLVAVQLLWP
jgi:uncharacterized membrane protein YfcA